MLRQTHLTWTYAPSSYERRILSDQQPKGDGLSPKFWIGMLILIVVAIFIGLNRDDATVSFGILDAQTQLWVALTVAAGLGFLSGWFIGRRRN